MRGIVVLGLVLCGGCARQTGLVNELSSAESMRESLLARAPLGTPLAAASVALTTAGFSCSAPERSTFGTTDSLSFAYCTARSSGSITFRVWQVAVVDSSGVVSDIRVTTGLVGP